MLLVESTNTQDLLHGLSVVAGEKGGELAPVGGGGGAGAARWVGRTLGGQGCGTCCGAVCARSALCAPPQLCLGLGEA